MEKSPFNNLNPVMKERLERWEKNTLLVKSAEKIRGTSHSSRRHSTLEEEKNRVSEFLKRRA